MLCATLNAAARGFVGNRHMFGIKQKIHRTDNVPAGSLHMTARSLIDFLRNG
jgi:hypothetical protein